MAVATAVLLDGDQSGEVVAPATTRIDGPVPTVVSHDDDDAEAAWAAMRAKMSRLPGRRWSSIAVLTRTNAQLAKAQAAMDAAQVPSMIAGSDLGPASDLREGIDIDRPARGDSTGDSVVLSTFHRAKGLQWPTVIVLGLSSGLMPIGSALTPAAIEEERRLLYVALTRAEEELWCSWFASADGVARQPSPWLEPIEGTIRRLAREAAPTAASEVPARVAELRRRLDEVEQHRPGQRDQQSDPQQDQ